MRFADTTLIDFAACGTPVDLELAYTLSAQSKLVLTAHEVYLPKPKLAVEGPGGVQASFDFRGAKERCRRSDAHGYAHQRPRWISLRVMLPGSGVGHGRLIHRSLLRLIPESVDECDGRMTFSLSLGVPGEDRDSVGAEGERRTPQSVRPERSSGSAGSPPSPIAARSAPAIARRKHAGAARRRIPADPARCRAHRTARLPAAAPVQQTTPVPPPGPHRPELILRRHLLLASPCNSRWPDGRCRPGWEVFVGQKAQEPSAVRARLPVQPSAALSVNLANEG